MALTLRDSQIVRVDGKSVLASKACQILGLVFYILSLIPEIALQNEVCYPHFSNEKIEAQRV